MIPIDYDVTLMFYFDILGQRPTAHEHDDLSDIFGVSQFHVIYICFLVLGVDPEAHG